MTPEQLLLLGVAGSVAGWVNTLAGGGSLLTLPALMLFGLPADVANATNRVAIVAQCVTGMAGYGRAGRLGPEAATRVLPPTLLGAGIGAYLATCVPDAVFRPILLLGMLAVAATLLIDRRRPLALDAAPRPPDARGLAALFACGLYGGFLQAGVGLMLIAVLVGLLRYDLLRANALKLTVVLAFTLVSVAVFSLRGRVVWGPALALAAGNALGAHLGVRFAVRRGQAAVRRVVVATVVLSCGYLLLSE